MKFSIVFFSLALCIFNLFGQQGERCLFDKKLQEALLANPSLADSINAEVVWTDSPEAVVTIPVVVHVIYRTSTQNISASQVQSQITALNRDFRKQNTDISQVPAAFAPLTADTEIQFCLASKDPQGNPTDGITRTQTSIEDIGDSNFYSSSANGGADAWPRNKYLNIWVCEFGSNTLGFAFAPGTAQAAYDGVVINYRAFGTVGTAQAPFNQGRTATHEIGHFFNLRHIWGDTNCGNDFVNDTPTQINANFGCETYPHRANSCGTTNPDGDMFMNYMDYVNDACMVMFTAGQKARMLAALNSAAGQRSSLKTSDVCAINAVQERESGAFSIKAFPVPADEFLILEIPDPLIGEHLVMLDFTGKIVHKTIALGRLEIEVSGLESGIYFIVCGTSRTKIVIK